MPLTKRALAEFFGTFWLVFGGCGAALFAAGFPGLGIGFAGVALAFGQEPPGSRDDLSFASVVAHLKYPFPLHDMKFVCHIRQKI